MEFLDFTQNSHIVNQAREFHRHDHKKAFLYQDWNWIQINTSPEGEKKLDSVINIAPRTSCLI